MRLLDLNCCPLEGLNLIEASAGTGKTYTLQNLFARIILESNTPISEILLVTFTDSATSELRSRIRDILIQIREYCMDENSLKEEERDRILALISSKKLTKEEILSKVQDALREFDRANIYTIHAFCNFLLSNYAFESGSSFTQSLETDSKGVMESLSYSYFRERVYPSKFNSICVASFKLELSELVKFGTNYINTPIERLHFDGIDINKGEKIFKEIYEEALAKKEELLAYLILECGIFNKDKRIECQEIINSLENKISIEEPYIPIFKLVSAYSEMKPKDYNAKKQKLERPSELVSLFDKIDLMKLSKNCLLLDFKEYLDTHYETYREERGFLLFDDLLVKCERLIKDNPLFRETVRGLFKFGMIDEFQDTDSVQYTIFSEIFLGKTLFLVGDPKQSIYSFRGGDIHVYSKAKESVTEDKTYSLATNFRSSEAMVESINDLFSHVSTPFLDSAISYTNVNSYHKESKIYFKESSKPLHITLYQEQKTKPLLYNDIAMGCVKQIEDLLECGKVQKSENESERSIVLSDIAVLVMTNLEGKKIKRALEKRGVPAVLQSEELLFDTSEAKEFLRLLEAIETPSKTERVRGVLVSSFINFQIENLGEKSDGEKELERLSLTLSECHKIWNEHTFLEMIEHFNRTFNIRNTLLKGLEGERKLTNYIHLIETLHTLCTKKSLSMNSAISWLSRHIYDKDNRDKEGDIYQLKLETDSKTVTIMTAHKSKGLEFNIVICPYLSFDSREIKSPYFKQGSAGKHFYFIDEVTGKNIDLVANTLLEAFSERMRLLYVVLTRGKYATFIHWAKSKEGGVSPIDYLLLRERVKGFEADGGKISASLVLPQLSQEKQKFYKEFLGDEEFISYEFKGSEYAKALSEITALKTLERIDVEIFVGEGYKKSAEPFYLDEENRVVRENLEFPLSKLDRGYKHASFSSFTYDLSQEKFTFDLEKDVDMQSIEIESDESQIGSLQDLVGGANTGSCLHKIFEDISFQSPRSEIELVAKRTLQEYKLYDENWPVVEKVADMVEAVLHVDLGGFSLAAIPEAERVCEMEFIFPIENRVESDKLSQFLLEYMRKFKIESQFLEFKQFVNKGFFNGFIDLLFCYNGRYYIVDWKSNKLKSYAFESICSEMKHHQYFFQYLLYSASLHKFLKRSIPNYSFEQHFGGVYYIFLRGVKEGSSQGIFSDFPTLDVIVKLSEILGGGDE